MTNTDKILILTFALACAAVPVIAADAPSAAPAAQAVGAAPATAAASDKPAAPKSKRKKSKAAAKSAAKPGTEPAAESASKPVAKPATTEQTASEAPAADTASASPAPEAAIPLVEPAAPATPQAARVRVKDRAAAAAAVAAAQSDEAPAEPTAAVAASDAPAVEAVPDTTKPVAEAAPETTKPVTPAAPAIPTAESEPLLVAECNPPFKSEVAALFDRWNTSLRSGDPKKVVANYAPGALLLPTTSNRARFTVAEKEEYFAYLLKRHPEGRIDDRVIDVDCNSATDSGFYTFRFGDGTQVKARYTFAYKRIDGEWLIASHHSSGMPEKTEPATEQKSAKPAVKSVEDTKAWVRFP